MCSVTSNSLMTPWTIACQAPLSMVFPRPEYWSGLPFPPPGDLPNLGVEPVSPALAGEFFTTEPPLEIYSLVDETKFSEKQDEEDDSDDGGEGDRHLRRTSCCQFLC